MKEIKLFLNEILTAQSITKDIRKKALLLRDSIDLAQKVSVSSEREDILPPDNIVADTTIVYNGMMNGLYGQTLSLVDLNQCFNLALNCNHPIHPGKIAFIKEVRFKFGCGLKEAKELVEDLHLRKILQHG